jgi:hypothetical protein
MQQVATRALLSRDYISLYPALFITTAMRTSDPTIEVNRN